MPHWDETTEGFQVADREKTSPDDVQKLRLTEPTDPSGVDLSEHFRKGTDPFPVVNMAPEDVQPAVSADPPPGTEPRAGDG